MSRSVLTVVLAACALVLVLAALALARAPEPARPTGADPAWTVGPSWP